MLHHSTGSWYALPLQGQPSQNHQLNFTFHAYKRETREVQSAANKPLKGITSREQRVTQGGPSQISPTILFKYLQVLPVIGFRDSE